MYYCSPKKWLLGLFGSGSCLAMSGVALADTLTPPPPAPSAQVEEIVVTAQRRTERSQDVPIAVTALSGSSLENAGIQTTDELAAVTPGLLLNRQLGRGTPYLRGIGTSAGTASNEASIATYVDGIYNNALASNLFSFNNVERIEVLKGPQGTLFGRNATGGLINVITYDPTPEPQVRVGVKYGTYQTSEGKLYMTGGTERLAANFATYAIRQSQGYGIDLATGRDVNRQNETSLRGKLRWVPSDNDVFTVIADWSQNKTDFGVARNVVPGSELVLGTVFRGSRYDTQTAFPPDVNLTQWGVALRYQHEFGWAELSSLTAYRHLHSLTDFEQSGGPIVFIAAPHVELNPSLQQEILLSGKTGRADWTTGIFLFGADSSYDPLRIISIVPALNTSTYDTQKTRSYAAFSQGTYSLTDTTRLTAGARVTRDNLDFSGSQIANSPNPAAGRVLATNVGRKSYTQPSWRLAIDQKLTSDVMVYVSYSRGYKSGLFNTSAFTQPAVAPELLDSYEAGAKSEWLNRTVRLNGSAFYYDYTNIQLNRVQSGVNILFNAAAGRVRGLEIDSELLPPMPVGRLEFTGALSLLDATYTSLPKGPVSVPNAAGGATVVTRDLSGNNMVQSPRWTLSVGGQYSLPVGRGTAGGTVRYYHNAGYYWESDNRLRQKPYNLLNAQIYYAFGSEERYKIHVFGDNLTNAVYDNYVSGGSLGDQAAPAPPRTYGVGFDIML